MLYVIFMPILDALIFLHRFYAVIYMHLFDLLVDLFCRNTSKTLVFSVRFDPVQFLASGVRQVSRTNLSDQCLNVGAQVNDI